MPGYISEFDYYGDSSAEFIEIALPAGTDPSGYSMAMYYNNGGGSAVQWNTFSLGTSVATINGQDIYVIDNSSPGFSTGDPMGNFYADDAMALVDGGGTVLQFISWEGYSLTAADGPASGLTSSNVGFVTAASHSMQSDNGGASYYSQSAPNKNTIPACYGRDTLIETDSGPVPVQDLQIGDLVKTVDGAHVPIRWIWDRVQKFDDPETLHAVNIRASSIGPRIPAYDLIVSPQHRVAVGGFDQLALPRTVLCPAKALLRLPGVDPIKNRASIRWWHILCDKHELIRANGMVSETMLLGHQMYRAFSPDERKRLRKSLDVEELRFGQQPPALPCLGASASGRLLDRMSVTVP